MRGRTPPADGADRATSMRLARGQDGITGIETAILLLAFVVVASAFLLRTGALSAERSGRVASEGVNDSLSALPPLGDVVGIAVVGHAQDRGSIRREERPGGLRRRQRFAVRPAAARRRGGHRRPHRQAARQGHPVGYRLRSRVRRGTPVGDQYRSHLHRRQTVCLSVGRGLDRNLGSGIGPVCRSR